MQPEQKKNSCSTYHSFNLFFSITTYHFLTTDSKLAIARASAFRIASVPVFISLLRITFVSIQKLCQGNFGKFQESSGSSFSGSEKDRQFFKISKWQHKFARDCKRGNIVYYFPNNAGKTCIYGPKISENIEIEHVFQPKAYFHFSRNLNTSYFSTFKSFFKPQFTFSLNFAWPFILMTHNSFEMFQLKNYMLLTKRFN